MGISIFRKGYETGWKIAEKFTRDNITLYSAQTAYFVVVSIIPFAVVLVPMLMLLIPDDTMDLINSVILLLPGELGTIVDTVIDRLMAAPSTSVVSVYALVSLWAASKGIMSLQNGLHGIYHIKETENYFIRRFRCMLYTLVFLAAILMAFGLLVLGNTLEKLLLGNYSFWGYLARFLLSFRSLIMLLVFIAAFTAGYKYLAGTRCTFRDALPGVVLTTVSWFIFSGLYGLYISYFSRYITLYGSLGALIFLFLWLYFCIVILMIGAEFNVYYADWRARKARQRDEKEEVPGGLDSEAAELMEDYLQIIDELDEYRTDDAD